MSTRGRGRGGRSSSSGRHTAPPATLPVAVRAKLATSPSSSSSDSASPPSSNSSSALPQCSSPLQQSPPQPFQRPRPPTPHPTATSEASEAEPTCLSAGPGSPSGPSTLNHFPFVTADTRGRPTMPCSSPSPAEVVSEAPSAAGTSDSPSCETPPPNVDGERGLESAADTGVTAVQMPEGGHLVTRGWKVMRVRPRVNIAKEDYPRLSSYKLPGLSLGNCMAVHHTGRIYAVSGRVGSGFSPTKFDPDDRMKSVGDGTCLIHVHSLAESDELHFVGPPGPIVDMAFAHSATPASEFFLGCMDARGNVGVYRLTCQDLGFCNLKKENFLIWMNDGAPSSIEGSPFIRWCPFACPEVAEEDFSKTLLTVVGAKVEVVHLHKIRTKGQQTYTPSTYSSPGHQVFEDHKSAIVDAKISPDGSGFATASKDGIRFYLMEDNEAKYSFADSYKCGNDFTLISSIAFPDDVTDRRSDLYPWSRMIVGLNGNSVLILVDLTEKDKPTLQTIELMQQGACLQAQPMPMAVSPDGKFFLISGFNKSLFHFDFTSRQITALTEMDLNLGNDIGAMSVVLDCENMQSCGPSFEFFAKCKLGGGEFRCVVELDAPTEERTRSSPYSAFSSVRKTRKTQSGSPEKGESDEVKFAASRQDGDGDAVDNEHCTSGENTEDNLSEVCDDGGLSDDGNGDVVVECIEELVYDDEQNRAHDVIGHSSNDQRVKVNPETDEPSKNDRHDVDIAPATKEVATNTCHENSPSESVPRMLFDLVNRVNAIEHKLGMMIQALGDIRNQHEE